MKKNHYFREATEKFEMLFSNFCEEKEKLYNRLSTLETRKRNGNYFLKFEKEKQTLNPPQVVSLRGSIVPLVAFVCLFLAALAALYLPLVRITVRNRCITIRDR